MTAIITGEKGEGILRAIRTGDVDSVLVETEDGPQVFALQGVDAASNDFRGDILAQVGDAVIAVDGAQRVIYLNAAAKRQYRVAASDALGRLLSEICVQQWSSPETEAGMRAALGDRGEWRGDIPHRTKDSGDIGVETSVTALRNASGTPAGHVGVFRDITERKRMEDELRQSTPMLRAIIESTGDVVFAKFFNGALTYANPATLELIGRSLTQVLGQTDADFLSNKAGAQQIMVNDRRVMDSGHRRRCGRGGAPARRPAADIAVAEDAPPRRTGDFGGAAGRLALQHRARGGGDHPITQRPSDPATLFVADPHHLRQAALDGREAAR